MTQDETLRLRSLEGVDTKVISYEIFCRCRGEVDAHERVIQERRQRLVEHYTNPEQTPEEKRLQLTKHYTNPI